MAQLRPLYISLHTSGDGDVCEIALSVTCPSCDGRGTVPDFDSKAFDDCKSCQTTGVRLTYPGYMLAHFLIAAQEHPDFNIIDPIHLP